MTFFEPHQVRFVRFLPDDGAGFLIDLPDLSYDGRVIVRGAREEILRDPAATAVWVAEQLDVMATKLGFNVTCGRLASPVELSRND